MLRVRIMVHDLVFFAFHFEFLRILFRGPFLSFFLSFVGLECLDTSRTSFALVKQLTKLRHEIASFPAVRELPTKTTYP